MFYVIKRPKPLLRQVLQCGRPPVLAQAATSRAAPLPTRAGRAGIDVIGVTCVRMCVYMYPAIQYIDIDMYIQGYSLSKNLRQRRSPFFFLTVRHQAPLDRLRLS